MDQQSAELEKRLEKLEQEFCELRTRIDELASQAANRTLPQNEKKPKGKRILRICIPVLIVCLLAGVFFFYHSNEKPSYAEAEIGDIVTFGIYEQNGSEADGPEPIEWIVLDKQDGKIMLLSKYILFKDSNSGRRWKGCKLQIFLNDGFISSAFTQEEQSKICTTINEDNRFFDSSDKVFLLSSEEAEYYFPFTASRICELTPSCNPQSGNQWWLRSSNLTGERYNNMPLVSWAYVFNYGEIKTATSTNLPLGVRPALWLDTTK